MEQSKLIPASDKGWILQLSREKKDNLMNAMLSQDNIGVFIEFAKILISEPSNRGGLDKRDINAIYSKYYPGKSLEL